MSVFWTERNLCRFFLLLYEVLRNERFSSRLDFKDQSFGDDEFIVRTGWSDDLSCSSKELFFHMHRYIDIRNTEMRTCDNALAGSDLEPYCLTEKWQYCSASQTIFMV